ncbi:MAG: ion transporter [Cyanobacteria bacterium P01_E01_bin.42]
MWDAIARFVESRLFKISIVAIIILAGILIGLQTNFALVERYHHLFTVLEGMIIGVFLVEFILKVLAEKNRPWRYFYDAWNIFDFLILIGCIVLTNGQYIMILRMVRLLRVMKLVRSFPQLQILVEALLRSLPATGYVVLLLCLLFYIYGVAGTFMFGANDPFHFKTLGLSMLSMFRAVTLEGWPDLMYTQMYGCDRYGYDGREALCVAPEASPLLSAAFFSSFILIGAFIVINLLIGVMTNSIEETHRSHERVERQMFLDRRRDTRQMERQLHAQQEQLNSIQASLEQIQQQNELQEQLKQIHESLEEMKQSIERT